MSAQQGSPGGASRFEREASGLIDSGDDSSSRVVRAAPAQCDILASLMAASFDQDPVSAWLFPDGPSRRTVQSRFFVPFLELVFESGEVYTTEAGHGVALWLPVDPANHEDIDGPTAFDERMRWALGDHERFGVLSARMDEAHPAHHRHQYLIFIAVAPEQQGTGVGTRLLADRLEALDASGTPSYLEASCARNQKLYERLGFHPVGEPIDLPDGPQLTPMWRAAPIG
jgi:GNAT superfamily N-acetyltransferase